MYRAVQLITLLVVVGIGHAQINLGFNGTASQSSTYTSNGISYDATLAVTGGPTHDFNTGSCSQTYVQTVAWWMLTFPSETIFTSRVIIYYRSDTQWRFAGFSLYITNNSILENASSPPSDGLCYHHNHNGTELPNIFQNITCDQMGKHVIIYNERKDGVTYPNSEKYAFVELCHVEIIGCYKTWWGGGCLKSCPSYCIDNHCHSGNGTCVWGCRSDTNCFDGDCNNDGGTCTKGCVRDRGGLWCTENNVANGMVLVISDTPNQNALRLTDGDKRETSCVILSGTDSWFQVDTGRLHAIKSINIIFKDELSFSGYFVSVTNTSADRLEPLNITNNSSVIYTHPFPVHEHRLNSMVVGRYVVVSKKPSASSMDICELEIVGCPLGMYGDLCEQDCPVNCHVTCHLENGTCVFGCKSGFIGDVCNQECDNGYFGDCLSKCHCRDGYCDKSTGACPGNQCDRGWMGDTCSEECTLGTFGYNCKDKCNGCVNNTCEVYDGNCTYGCQVEYTNHQCKISVEEHNPLSVAGAIGGVISGLLVVGVIVIGVVFLKRRRIFASNKSDKNALDLTNRTQDRNDVNRIYEETASSIEDRNEYDSLASVNTNTAYAFCTEDAKKESVYVNHDTGNDVIYYNMPSTTCPADEPRTIT